MLEALAWHRAAARPLRRNRPRGAHRPRPSFPAFRPRAPSCACPAVSISRTSRFSPVFGIGPLPVDRDRIARDPGLGAGQQPVFAQQPIDQRGLARIGPADDGELERAGGDLVAMLVQFGRGRLFGFGAVEIGPQRFEQIDQPFAMFGGEGNRIAQAERIGFHDARARSRGLRPCWPPAPPARLFRAASCPPLRRAGSRPARASITNSATAAPSTEISVWARIRPGRLSGSSSSQPAVSTIVKSSPSRCASPMRRSRVTPGWSSTSASFLPISRLNSVDLPTLGRPMMMTWGRGAVGMGRRWGAGGQLASKSGNWP